MRERGGKVGLKNRRRPAMGSTGRGGVFDAVFGATAEVVSAATALWLVSRRDLGAVLLVTGSLLNAVFNRFLKKVIRQERPNAGGERDGMPSSHACSLAFLAASVPLGLGVVGGGVPWSTWSAAASALATLFAWGGTYQRVRSGRHTVPQVVAGYAVGTVNATLWSRVATPRLAASPLLHNPALVAAFVGLLLVAGAAVVFYKRLPARRAGKRPNIT